MVGPENINKHFVVQFSIYVDTGLINTCRCI